MAAPLPHSSPVLSVRVMSGYAFYGLNLTASGLTRARCHEKRRPQLRALEPCRIDGHHPPTCRDHKARCSGSSLDFERRKFRVADQEERKHHADQGDGAARVL
jgi:hypothetical protein